MAPVQASSYQCVLPSGWQASLLYFAGVPTTPEDLLWGSRGPVGLPSSSWEAEEDCAQSQPRSLTGDRVLEPLRLPTGDVRQPTAG